MSRFQSYADSIKVFGMTKQIAEIELTRIEEEMGISLGRNLTTAGERDEAYYPQFDQKIRKEAAEMAKHYEIFAASNGRSEDLWQRHLRGTKVTVGGQHRT